MSLTSLIIIHSFYRCPAINLWLFLRSTFQIVLNTYTNFNLGFRGTLNLLFYAEVRECCFNWCELKEFTLHNCNISLSSKVPTCLVFFLFLKAFWNHGNYKEVLCFHHHVVKLNQILILVPKYIFSFFTSNKVEQILRASLRLIKFSHSFFLTSALKELKRTLENRPCTWRV